MALIVESAPLRASYTTSHANSPNDTLNERFYVFMVHPCVVLNAIVVQISARQKSLEVQLSPYFGQNGTRQKLDIQDIRIRFILRLLVKTTFSMFLVKN